MGLKAYHPHKKQVLTAKMHKQHLLWSKEHAHRIEDTWETVIFSDESKLNLHGSDGKLYVWCREGEQYHPDCLVSTVKFPASQMVWGCISSKRVGRLHFIKGTVNEKSTIS
jgi:hypothetical protein